MLAATPFIVLETSEADQNQTALFATSERAILSRSEVRTLECGVSRKILEPWVWSAFLVTSRKVEGEACLAIDTTFGRNPPAMKTHDCFDDGEP